MDDLQAQMKKAILIFAAAEAIFIGGAIALWLGVFQPQLREAQEARDEAVRTGVALQARARAVEARYALTVMDVPGAKRAAGDVRAALLGLAERVPAGDAQQASEVKQLADRAALAEGALDVDPNAARKDLEMIEAKLAALYPAYAAAPPARK